MKIEPPLKAVTLLLLFATDGLAQSQWSAQSDLNNPIVKIPFVNQDSPALARDGSNGAVITWVDKNNLDIYAQRIDEAGRLVWGSPGKPIALGDEGQNAPTLTADLRGNLIFAWLDRNNLFNDAEVRVQKFNSNGAPQWPSPKNPQATVAHQGEHSAPLVLFNESEIITASYSTFGIDDLILVQIISAIDGTERFTFSQGIVSLNARGRQPDQPPAVAPALNGGIIACWADARPKMGVVAKGLLGNGTAWSAGEKVVSDSVSINTYPVAVSDGNGGAILVWIEPDDAGNDLIKAVRLDSDGVNVWGDNVEISTTPGIKENLRIATDGQSAYLIWEITNITSTNLYIQRIFNQDGSSWNSATKLSELTAVESNAAIALSGAGSAIVAWQDNGNSGLDIFCQFIDGTGVPVFNSPIEVSTANGDQQRPVLVDDGFGGAIVVWQDSRSGDSDIYAQRVNLTGTLGEFRTIELLSAVGNENWEIGSHQLIRWQASKEIENIKIELSRDGGETYSTIQESTENDGVHNFEVLGPPSDVCKIRITSIEANFLVDTSQDFFTISPKEAPEIVHEPQAAGTAGESIEINTTATDFSGVAEVILNYRKGGTTAFASSAMSLQQSDQFQGSIPAASVTERGVEYFVTSTDSIGLSSESDTFFIAISFGSGVETTGITSGSKQNSYRMISAPNILTHPQADSIFEISGFSAYDTTKWRLFQYREGKNVERDSINASSFRFNPGQAYWVISSENRTVNFGPGLSLPLDSAMVNLSPGWNQIGQPFAFAVAWGNITRSGEVSMPSGFEGGYTPAAALAPYKGYFVYNFEDGDVHLKIPPKESSGSSAVLAERSENIDWQLQIKSTCEHATDAFNFIGISEQATLTWDPFDQPEPPPIGEYISVYFPQKNWQIYPNNYTSDYRNLLGEGQTWTFQVRTNIQDAEAQILIDGLETLPADLEIILIDEKLNVVQNVRTNPSYTFPSGHSGTVKSLKLVVGKSDYVAGKVADFSRIPTSFELDQNFPNPFNPATAIRYALPEESNVTIKVFDVLGRAVITLIADEQKKPGYHIVNWNGRNQWGVSVASGLYFYQIVTDRFSKTRKMLLVK